MERDFTDKIKIKEVDAIDVVALSAPYEVAGAAIDTSGLRGCVFGVEPAEAIGTDVLYLKVYECDTVGGTYTAVDSSKYLPTTTTRAIGDADADDFILKVGVFGTKRFIKPYIDADTVADDLTVNVYPVLFTAITDETGIDGNA
jgi:hypothetical protein